MMEIFYWNEFFIIHLQTQLSHDCLVGDFSLSYYYYWFYFWINNTTKILFNSISLFSLCEFQFHHSCFLKLNAWIFIFFFYLLFQPVFPLFVYSFFFPSFFSLFHYLFTKWPFFIPFFSFQIHSYLSKLSSSLIFILTLKSFFVDFL